jgi:chemoreceptor-like protein with four helix bundle sensory module
MLPTLTAGRSVRLPVPLTVLALATLIGTLGCSTGKPGLVLTDQIEARRLGADLRVQFTMAADAANRAVMADTDEASTDAAQEALKARQQVENDISALESILKGLGYTADIQSLDEFKRQFAEYKKVDDETLNLAVENTNLKAQRLSFTTAQTAVDDFRKALDTLPRLARPNDRSRVEALIGQATASALSIQVIQARHIAESDDQSMTKMEDQMALADRDARRNLADLQPLVPKGGQALSDANTALNQLKTVNDEIVQLSRRNTNVRSLALALGQLHSLRAKCEAALQMLNESLAQHEFKATK